jgi:ketosteroid isomerase-like protein
MAAGKLEIAREALAEFNRTQRASDYFAEDFVWDFAEFQGWMEDTEYLGRGGFDAQMARWTQPFSNWNWELSELIDLGGDELLAVGTQRGVLRESAAAVEMPIAQIWTVRAQKLSRIRMFRQPADAFEAAGLARPVES